MAVQFASLFSPIQVGSLTLRNRVVMQPTSSRYADANGAPGERMLSYYRARAKGGAGLIISEVVITHPTTMRPAHLGAYDRRYVPGLERLARAVHEHETPLLGQLGHGGRQFTNTPSSRVTWGVSAIPDVMYGGMPHEMSVDEVQELIAGFIESAANLQEAGFDGVEVHGAQGHLCQQFLSPWTNHRTDRYGGSVENRMRFMTEIVDGVRKRCGSRFVVGVRLCGDEFTDGGLVIEDVQEIARKLAPTSQVDYLCVTQGNFNGASFSAHCPEMAFPPTPFVHLAAAVKEVVDLPIMTTSRILDPFQAERLLQEGAADLIGMCRAMIADHEWARKAREGRPEQIRPCISCNQGCHAMIHANRPLTCLLSPIVGKEDEWERWIAESTPRVKKVVVVGGGPAGLEAARVAAIKGHKVVLFEREAFLGGQVKLAATLPSRAEMDGITRYLSGELDRLGVDVRLGVEASAETLLAERPDVVIVATGAEPHLPDFADGANPAVVTVADVLAGKAEVGQRVIVADEDGHYKATALAEWLADQGKEVQIIALFGSIGTRMPPVNLPGVKQRLYLRNVAIAPDSKVVGARDGRVTVANTLTWETREIEGIDTVVLASHHRARTELYEALKGKVPELHAIGDCLAPRLALDAVHDGHEIARGL
ncbi:MAG: oxidoreductase [Chloroflexota bacterium]